MKASIGTDRKLMLDYFMENKSLIIQILNEKLDYVIMDIQKSTAVAGSELSTIYLDVISPCTKNSTILVVRYLSEKQEFEIEIDSIISTFESLVSDNDDYFYEQYFVLTKDLKLIDYFIYLRTSLNAYPQIEMKSNEDGFHIRQRYSFDDYSNSFKLPLKSVYDEKMKHYCKYLCMFFIEHAYVLNYFNGDDLITMIQNDDEECISETQDVLSMVKI